MEHSVPRDTRLYAPDTRVVQPGQGGSSLKSHSLCYRHGETGQCAGPEGAWPESAGPLLRKPESRRTSPGISTVRGGKGPQMMGSLSGWPLIEGEMDFRQSTAHTHTHTHMLMRPLQVHSSTVLFALGPPQHPGERAD